MPGKRLTEQERGQIEAFWRAGWSFPEIGAAIGRDPSTVWREVSKYNSHRHGHKNPLRQEPAVSARTWAGAGWGVSVGL